MWTVFIFGIFHMYKNYYCEIMRPPSSDALAQVRYFCHNKYGTESRPQPSRPRPRTWPPRPRPRLRTWRVVLEAPRVQGHGLEVSISAYMSLRFIYLWMKASGLVWQMSRSLVAAAQGYLVTVWLLCWHTLPNTIYRSFTRVGDSA